MVLKLIGLKLVLDLTDTMAWSFRNYYALKIMYTTRVLPQSSMSAVGTWMER